MNLSYSKKEKRSYYLGLSAAHKKFAFYGYKRSEILSAIDFHTKEKNICSLKKDKIGVSFHSGYISFLKRKIKN